MARNGFSMIELLVALIIFSVGLLGTMALQTNSTAMGKSANDRLRALLLAQDMSERIQANPTAAVVGGGYDNVAINTTGAQQNCTTCSPAQVASNDIFEWKQALAAQLPGGNGTITTINNSLRITVSWNTLAWSGTGKTHSTASVTVDLLYGS